MKMHICIKRSESLQDYLDNLNTPKENEKDDDWGFFVDLEIDAHAHKEKLKFNKQKQIIKETHHHYHHYYHDLKNEDVEKEDDKNAENKLISYGNALVFAGFLAYILLF
jgi:hypothetical protein